MDKTLESTIESYQNKADGLRAIGAAMTDPVARMTLLDIVANYDRMIGLAEAKLTGLHNAKFPAPTTGPFSLGTAMRRSTLGRAAYFRARADEARAMADGMSDARARSSMRGVGDDYDKIADTFEREPR